MSSDLLRLCVAGLAAIVSGAMLVVMSTYVWASWRAGRAAGALRVRHVVEVTAGTLGLVATAGVGIYDAIPGVDVLWPGATERLWLYLVSMALLLLALLEVGSHTQRRRRCHACRTGPDPTTPTASRTSPAVPVVRTGRHHER